MSESQEIQVVGIHANAEEALRKLPQCKPDVVLMDIKMPGMDGIQCLRHLKRVSPPVHSKVLMLTGWEDDDLVFEALRTGACGYLLKNDFSSSKLTAAIKDVVAGDGAMSPAIARKVIEQFQRSADPLDILTLREHEVLRSLAKGRAYKEIGDEFSITLNTVRKHLGAVYSKLHVHSRSEATLRYLGLQTNGSAAVSKIGRSTP